MESTGKLHHPDTMKLWQPFLWKQEQSAALRGVQAGKRKKKELGKDIYCEGGGEKFITKLMGVGAGGRSMVLSCNHSGAGNEQTR